MLSSLPSDQRLKQSAHYLHGTLDELRRTIVNGTTRNHWNGNRTSAFIRGKESLGQNPELLNPLMMQGILEHHLGSTYTPPKLDFYNPQDQAAINRYKRQLETPETTVLPSPGSSKAVEEINKRFLGLYSQLLHNAKSMSPPPLPIATRSRKGKPTVPVKGPSKTSGKARRERLNAYLADLYGKRALPTERPAVQIEPATSSPFQINPTTGSATHSPAVGLAPIKLPSRRRSISQEKTLSASTSPASRATLSYEGSPDPSSALSDTQHSEEASDNSITVKGPKKTTRRQHTLASTKRPQGIRRQTRVSGRKQPLPPKPTVKPETATEQLPSGVYKKGGWTYNLDEPASDTELNPYFRLRRIISTNRHSLINKKPLPNARYIETGIYPHDGDSLKTALDQEVSFDLTALKQDVKKIGGSFDNLLPPIAGTRKRRIHNATPKDQRKPKKAT